MGRDDARVCDAVDRARGHALHVVARAMDVYRAANGYARGAVVDMDDKMRCRCGTSWTTS